MQYGCRSCGTKFAVGLEACPNCQGTDIATDPREVEDLERVREEKQAEQAEADRDYSGKTVPELKAELDRRKSKYEQAGDTEGVDAVTYKASDKRDDLVTLLEADDEAQEG